MIGKIVIFLCYAALFIVVDGKSLAKSQHKNVGPAIVKLILSQEDINRGVSIQISAQRNVYKENEVNRHLRTELRNSKLSRYELTSLRKSRHAATMKRRFSNKSQSKLLKSLAPVKNETENELNFVIKTNQPTVFMRSMRNKRSLTGREVQVEDLRKLIEGEGNDDPFNDEFDSTEHMRTRSLIRRSQSFGRRPQQNYGNSDDNGEYAYDNTDDDRYNENDEILRQHSRRGADGTYLDLIKKIRSENEPENRAIKTINYGRGHSSSSLPNDYVGFEEQTYDEDPMYDNYDNYYDY